jgi:phenylacetate-CoA ligase
VSGAHRTATLPHVEPPGRGELEPIEIASRDEIAALQLQRLGATLRHAYANVAHFRARCAALDAHPDDCRELADLARFPFATKDDLRQTYPFGMFAVPREQVLRLHASSGTTGTPTLVGYTRQDLDTWSALVARCLRASGVRSGDMVHVAYGYGLFTGGLGAHYGAEAHGCTVVPVSGGMTERQVKLIQDLRPDAIMVTPSYMLAIADEFERQGLDPRASSLRIGIHGAEPWTNALRQEIESRLAMHAVDIYGLSEVLGPGVANECIETKDGLHLWEDHFYPEVIDPATGAVLPDGTVGELVLTTLTKQGLPMIRYRTRDLTRLLPGTARTMRRIEKITGRSDDMLIIRGVNLFPSQIEELILAEPALSGHYLLEVSRPSRLDELKVIAELRPQAEYGAAATQRVAEGLQDRIKSLIGITATIDIAAVGSVERSVGKAKRVIDLRAK